MLIRRIAALLASSAVLLGAPAPGLVAQDASPPVVAKPGPVTLPFLLVASNHMVVEAKINGKGPFRLIFDSGAPVSLLANKAAEESGAVAKDAPKSFLMGLRGEGSIKSLEVGDLKAKDVPVVVLDHPTLKAIGGFLRKPIDGIIGFTFFARYRTTIDYQARVMTLEPVDFAVRDLLKELPDRLAGPKVARTPGARPGRALGPDPGRPGRRRRGRGDQAGPPRLPRREGRPQARRRPDHPRRPMDQQHGRRLRSPPPRRPPGQDVEAVVDASRARS